MYFFEYAHLGTATSRILMYLLFGWFYWLFGVFATRRRYASLPREVIYNVLSILRKDVFDKSIFDRMKCYHCNLATDPESPDSLSK